MLSASTPVRASTVLHRSKRSSAAVMSWSMSTLGRLRGARGHGTRMGPSHAGTVRRSAELVTRSRAMYEDLGLRLRGAFVAESAGGIQMLAGDPVAAEREFRTCLDELAEMGEQGIQSTVAAALAHALIEQGRLDEAEESVSASELAGAEDDVSTKVLDRSARARIQAGRGLYDEAEKLARDAVALSESTDDLNMRGDTLAYLGDVLSAAGNQGGVATALESALRLYESKGNAVAADSTRRRLADR